MNAKSANVTNGTNPAPILEKTPSVLNQAAPFIEALGAAAKNAKSAVDERNVTRAFLLEFFRAQRSPLTFLAIIDGLRSDGYKTSIAPPSAGEKRAIVLSHLACGGSFNDLPTNLYEFALQTGLVNFAAKIRGT